jgi:CubicO group peptidase (beta-lactamase class C family)
MNEHTTHGNNARARPRALPASLIIATLLGVAALVTAIALLWPDLLHLNRAPASDWPTDGWATSTPAEQDMDDGKLAAMTAYIDEHDIAVDGLVMIRHGRLVFETYGPGYSPRKLHILHSVTKSVTSMLVGIAIDHGYLEGLDMPLSEILPGRTMANPDPRKDRITLEHLLEMSDGIDWREHDWPYDDPRNPVYQMNHSEDAVQFVLDRPMAYEPGEVWAYNSGATILLGAAVQEATGRDLTVFAREMLFDPLGIGTTYWEHSPGGYVSTHGGLNMAPRDLARIGYLMLHHGTWDGQQIISADWVTRSTTEHQPAEGPYGYGYQWRILPDGQGIKAEGLYQQYLYVLPEADMVIAATADIRDASLYRVEGLVNTFILPACTDLPPADSRTVYDAHDLTFEYPVGFFVQEMPIPGHATVSDASGMMQITSNTEPLEIVSVLWNRLEGGEDARAFLDLYLAGIAEEEMGVAPGESREGRHAGHAMAIRFSDLTLEEGTLPAVSAAWICDASDRAFAVTYLAAAETTPDERLAALERYLAGLACH